MFTNGIPDLSHLAGVQAQIAGYYQGAKTQKARDEKDKNARQKSWTGFLNEQDEHLHQTNASQNSHMA